MQYKAGLYLWGSAFSYKMRICVNHSLTFYDFTSLVEKNDLDNPEEITYHVSHVNLL